MGRPSFPHGSKVNRLASYPCLSYATGVIGLNRLLMVFIFVTSPGCASKALSLDDPSAFPMTVDPVFLYSGTQREYTVTANDLADADEEAVESGEVDLLKVTLNGENLRVATHRFLKQFELKVEFEVDSDIPTGFHDLVIEIRNRYGIYTLTRQVEIY